MTENEGDLISREALKNTAKIKLGDDITSITVLKLFEELIDNAPTVLFPLTVKITDTVTDEDIEVLKRLMKDYKPQVLNLETERPQGEWIWRSTAQWCSECNALKPRKYPYSNYCPNCGADMRGEKYGR